MAHGEGVPKLPKPARVRHVKVVMDFFGAGRLMSCRRIEENRKALCGKPGYGMQVSSGPLAADSFDNRDAGRKIAMPDGAFLIAA